jgi:hypothetical protein
MEAKNNILGWFPCLQGAGSPQASYTTLLVRIDAYIHACSPGRPQHKPIRVPFGPRAVPGVSVRLVGLLAPFPSSPGKAATQHGASPFR